MIIKNTKYSILEQLNDEFCKIMVAVIAFNSNLTNFDKEFNLYPS